MAGQKYACVNEGQVGIGRGAVQAQRAPVEPVYNLADADSDLQFRLLSLYRYLARRPLLDVDKIAEVVIHGSRKAEGVWRAASQRHESVITHINCANQDSEFIALHVQGRALHKLE